MPRNGSRRSANCAGAGCPAPAVVEARPERALLGAVQALRLAILLAQLLRGQAFGLPVLLLQALIGEPLARLGPLLDDARLRPAAIAVRLGLPLYPLAHLTVIGDCGAPFDLPLRPDLDFPSLCALAPLDRPLLRPRLVYECALAPLDILPFGPGPFHGPVRALLARLGLHPWRSLGALLTLGLRGPFGTLLAGLRLGLRGLLGALLAFTLAAALGLSGSGDGKRRNGGGQEHSGHRFNPAMVQISSNTIFAKMA